MNISKYIGIPYDKIDCFALVRIVGKELFNLNYPTLPEYSPEPQYIVAAELQKPQWVNIDYKDKRPGDVMTLCPHSGTPSHVGIVVDNLFVLHADKKYGVIAQTEAGLRRRGFLYRKVYRWIGL